MGILGFSNLYQSSPRLHVYMGHVAGIVLLDTDHDMVDALLLGNNDLHKVVDALRDDMDLHIVGDALHDNMDLHIVGDVLRDHSMGRDWVVVRVLGRNACGSHPMDSLGELGLFLVERERVLRVVSLVHLNAIDCLGYELPMDFFARFRFPRVALQPLVLLHMI